MTQKNQKHRHLDANIHSIFVDRWSPRAFKPESIPFQDIQSLFEAARWSPSSRNEQPWFFLYATDPDEKELFVSILNEANKEWAKNAPLLLYLITKRKFESTGKENRHSFFDCGAAWMSIALQARFLGLYAHAMAGFDREKAFQLLNVDSERYDISVAIAIGKHGDIDILPEHQKSREHPSERRDLADIFLKGVCPEKTAEKMKDIT